MAHAPLLRQQARTLYAYTLYRARNGIYPSARELANALGINTATAVMRLLRLRQDGFLVRNGRDLIPQPGLAFQPEEARILLRLSSWMPAHGGKIHGSAFHRFVREEAGLTFDVPVLHAMLQRFVTAGYLRDVDGYPGYLEIGLRFGGEHEFLALLERELDPQAPAAVLP
ncbi:MAG: hypothetical protein HY340_04140 [Candidatus Kerfeldbacteria bacterium]|nr:hypothetical protein [Candidatus Kerfeldbacteria bacterium]